jgi:CheY-like chemotaxis protein
MAPDSPFDKIVIRALADLGYAQDRNLTFSARGAMDHLAGVPGLIEELKAEGEEILVTLGYPGAAAAKAAGVPTVILWGAGDPVATGLVVGPGALELVRAAENAKLILILSDVNMPGMRGLELLPRARQLRPDVPVIMITTYGDAETRRKAIKACAEGLFTKPIDFSQLRGEIGRLLGAQPGDRGAA